MNDETQTAEDTAQPDQTETPQTEDSPVMVELANQAEQAIASPQNDSLEKAAQTMAESLPPVIASLYPKDADLGVRMAWLAAAQKVAKEEAHIIRTAPNVTPPRQMAPEPDLSSLPPAARLAKSYKN